MKKCFGIWSMIALVIAMTGVLTGVAQAQTTRNLSATADTWMRQSYPTYNYGGATIIQTSPNTSSRQNSLYLWDLSSIPSDATVNSASLTFYVTDASTYDFSLFNMKRTWVEGTNNGVAGTGASWTYYGAGTGSWASGGAMNTTSDRFDTDLWDATASTFAATGSVTVSLNASGINVIQGWIAGTLSNYGLTVQYMGSGTTADYLYIASSENTTYAVPTLNVTYTLSTIPTITTTGTLTAFSSAVGTTSAEQSYTVAGTNLSDAIVITAPPDFEISTTSGSGFGSSVSLTPTSGTVSSTTIFVRLNPTTSTTYSANITHTSIGATEKDIAVTGTSVPAITITGSLSAFATPPGVASTAQTYTVAGVNLTADISITVPSGFRISTDGSTYSSTLTLAQTSGTVTSTTVYVQLYSSTEGSFSGNITHTSSGATEADIAVTGLVSNSLTVSLVVSEDTHMRSGNTRAAFNYGGSTSIRVNPFYQSGSTDGQLTGALLKWNFSSAGIPIDATVTDASLTFYVTSGSNYAYSLYSMMRDWVEGTNDAVAGTGASWSYYDAGTNSWTTEGAQSTSSDRYNTNLWDATATIFNTTGSVTIPLNAEGIAVVQGWIAGSLNNYGLTIQNYSGTTVDVWEAASSEATLTANRPKLNITYSVSTGPKITATGILTDFTSEIGTPSTAQTYTIAGSNLTANISINAPSGFEISTDGSIYTSSLTLNQSGGSVPSTTIFVRLNSSIVGTFSGNITHTSTDATTKNIAVSGTASVYYTLTVNASNGSVVLNPAGGSYASGTVVTLTASGNTGFLFTSWSGDLSGGTNPTTITMDGDKTVTANFAAGTSATVNLEASEDTYMSSVNTTNNYGGTNLFKVSSQSSTNRGALIKWDVSSIPSNAIVTGVTMTVYVSTMSSQIYNLYNMRRSWVEGTNDAAAGTGASWTYYGAGTGNWGTVGAANITSDRYDINMWGAGTATFSSTGSKNIDLDADGLAVVQGWINGTIDNYGLTIQNYSGSTTANDLQISSSENTTNAGPTLNITYSVLSGTTYTLTIGNDGNGTVTLSPSGGTYAEGTVVTLTPMPGSGYAFSIWSGEDASDPNDNGNGTWSLTMDGNKTLTANFTLLPVNYAPNQPVLVQPIDNATGITTSPTLQVTVSDDNAADDLDVSFYGRAAGTTTAGADFTFVVIPDPQNYATSYPAVYNSQTQWIVDNKTTSNIVFATCVGDLVNTSSNTTEYTRADAAFDILDSGGVPYSVSPGNHDAGGLYSTYFGTSRFSGKSWYGGSYDNNNTYSLFSASGNDFIVINLQYSPGTAVLNWADALLKANTTRQGIVVQHDILNIDNNWVNQASYTALKDNPNLYLMLCGHMHSASDGAAYRAELGDDGHTIHIVQADYQDFTASGYLRVLRFSPTDDMIYMTTYSPYTGNSLTSTSNYDQANLVYDLINGTTADFTLIGSENNVTNGANASTTWPGLTADTEYEWYATVSDGIVSTTGSVWSFTTGSAPVNYTLTAGNDTHGTVTLSPAGGTYASGTTVTLTPVPDTDYQFSSWTGANAGEVTNAGGGIYTILMNGDKSITANFSPVQYTLNVTSIGNGSVTLSSPSPYIAGTVVTLTPEPGIGYQFDSWSGTDAGDIIDNSGTFTIIMDENKTIVANFIQIQYTLSISTIGDGSVSKDPDKATYTYGETVELTASPGTGYSFTGWTGDLISTNNPATITITGNKTITATFTAVNNAPEFTSIPITSATEDALYSYTAVASDVDAGDVLTFSTEALPAWLSFNATSHVLSGTPLNENVGDHIITIHVNDGHVTVDQVFTITVANVNNAPVFTSIPVTSATEDVLYSYTAVASDVDAGDVLTFSTETLPSWLSFNATSHVLSGTPLNENVGDHIITIHVNDGHVTVDQTFTITVGNINNAPVFTSIPVTSATEDALYSYTAVASDVDAGDVLTFSTETLPAWLSFNATSHVLSGTPLNENVGDHSITLHVYDGHVTVDQTFTITVGNINNAPVFTSIPVTSATEDALYSYTAVASDVDAGDVLTFSTETLPAWLSFNATSHVLSGTPLNENVGDHSVTIHVNDGHVTVDQIFTITVANVNNAPAFTSIPVTSATEDVLYSYTAVASDVDAGDVLTFSTETLPSWLSFNATSHVLSGTPLNENVGDHSITLHVYDGHVTVDQTFTITVGNINNAPVFTSIPVTSATEDALYSYTAVASDVDAGNVLTFSTETLPAWLSFNATSHVLSGTPLNENVGDHSITLHVYDGHVTVDQVFTITVANVNNAPAFTSIPVTSATEDALYSYTAVASDVDAGNVLTFSTEALPAWLSFNATSHVLSGTPLNENVGDHSITLHVYDGHVTVDQVFTITVANVNDTPVFTSIPVTSATEDALYSYTAVAWDVDAGDVLTFSTETLPSWLSFNATSHVLSGTPLNENVGDHSVTIHVNDGHVTVDQIFTITVGNINNAPVFTSIPVTSATEDALYSYTAVASDVDAGDVLTFSTETLPSWLSFNATSHVLSGTPLNENVGDHSITLHVYDGHVTVDQTFTITVGNINNAPVFTSIPVTSATEDALYSYTAVASDVDAGDVLTFSTETLPSWLSFNATSHVLSGTPLNENVGDYSITLHVYDGHVTVDQTFTITVGNINNAPVFTSIPVTSATEDVLYSYTAVASDVDAGDVLTFSTETLPSWLSFNATSHVLSGTPLNENVGDHSITIHVNDGHVTVDQIFTITVANLPSAKDTIKIDFGYYSTRTTLGGWNNVVRQAVGSNLDLINSNGDRTGFSLVITDAFAGVNPDGGIATGPLGIPATASSDSYYGNTEAYEGITEPTGEITLTKLDTTKAYSFVIFSSRAGVPDNRQTKYTITGQTTVVVFLDAANNTTNTANADGIYPADDGTIRIKAEAGELNTNSYKFYYLGVVKIIYDESPLTVASPNGGEQLETGEEAVIRWTSSGVSSIDIDYSTDNGSNWIPVVNSISASGKLYNWTVPSTLSDNCLVRLTDSSDPTVRDSSNFVFRIIPPVTPTAFTDTFRIDFGDPSMLTTLNGWNNVTDYTSGSVMDLVNSKGNVTGIALNMTDAFAGINVQGGTAVSSLGIPATGSGDSFYGMGPGQPTGEVTISNLNTTISYSFTIFSSRTGVTDNREAKYTLTGKTSVVVYLDASNNTSNTAYASGIYPADDGTIRIQAKAGELNTNSSGYYYLGVIIVGYNGPSTLELTSPNGGENWQIGSSQDITWTSGATSGNVYIEYSINNGTDWTEVIASTPDNGSYLWTIPEGPSTECLVRISDTDSDPTDISDAVFTISSSVIDQQISLLEGWNIFSLHVTPGNTNMLSIVQPLIDAGSLIKVLDEAGRAIEKNPITSDWINNIITWNNTEGYKIRVNAAATLIVTGLPIADPVNISLISGWNIISYPVSTSQDATDLLATLMDDGTLIKVQDEAGFAIEKMPVTGQWMNNIGTFDPDEGYKVRVSADNVLTIDPSLYAGSGTLKSAHQIVETSHFKPVWTGYGLDHMNIYLTEASDKVSGLKQGDEIGIYDGSICVGTGVIQHTTEKFHSFVVSADDPVTREVDGFLEGNTLSFKAWRPSDNREVNLPAMKYITGSSKVFEPMGSAWIAVNTASLGLPSIPGTITGLGNNYPNPFSTITTIPFTIAEESVVDIAIYNIVGERVSTLIHGNMEAGNYTTTWNTTDAENNAVMSGVYFCKMVAGNKVFVKKLEVIAIK